jgi:hypothetical protein
MKTNRQKTNWILDALLFTGFLVSFSLDLTGLPVHQWIGVFCGLLAVFHLVIHRDWAAAVTRRFFKKTSCQARTYYLLDAAIMLGFSLIVMTGTVISTWLNLALTNYAAWVDFHVTTAIVTLLLVVLKIGLHWRWIVRVATQPIFRPAAQPAARLKPSPVPATVPGAMTRGDFLRLMGIVGAASLAALSFTLNDDQGAQAAHTIPSNESITAAGATPAAASGTTGVSQPYSSPDTSTTTTSCSVRCNKGCSFPGDCRRYQDSNGNALCDFGECI